MSAKFHFLGDSVQSHPLPSAFRCHSAGLAGNTNSLMRELRPKARTDLERGLLPVGALPSIEAALEGAHKRGLPFQAHRFLPPW